MRRSPGSRTGCRHRQALWRLFSGENVEDCKVKMRMITGILAAAVLLAGSGAQAGTDGNRESSSMTTGNSRIVQTAGRDVLGNFAPEFAHFNDDVLFGENWNNQDISLKTRSLITVVSLMSQGITDSSLTYHLQNARNAGVTRKEIVAVITHAAFYAGWPKAWAVFRLAKDVWKDDTPAATAREVYERSIMFPVGEPNTAYAKYFRGNSYLAPVSTSQVKVFNVTFEPGCRNNWHIHHAAKGGGQILIAVGGRGYFQEFGKPPVEMRPGDVVNIPANVKHWHGAAPDSWFSHLAIEVDGTATSNEWLEPVSDEEYGKLK